MRRDLNSLEFGRDTTGREMTGRDKISDITPLDWLKSCLREEQPDWPAQQDTSFAERVWQAAQEHGVLSLCSHLLLQNTAREAIPPLFLEDLSKHTLHAAAGDLVQEYEVKQVLEELHGQGIFPLLMKGTPLAYIIYPQPHLRTRCDTDILFAHKADAERAWGVVRQMGYKRPHSISGEFISSEFTCFKSGKLGVEHALDFHWKVSNNQLFTHTLLFDELQTESVPVPCLGEQAYALNSVHSLLHACIHLLSHTPYGDGDRLIWLYDIHLLAKTFDRTKWENFTTPAVEKKICNICFEGLRKATSALATPVPADVWKILREAGEKERTTANMGSSRLRMELANFQSLPGWRERSQLLKEHLFPSADYLLNKYHTSNRYLLPYLYIRRLVQGIGKVFR